MTHSFIVSSGAFRKALQFIGTTISKNPIVPILENVKIEVADRKITLTATNLLLVLATTIEVEGSGDYVFVMPFKKASDLIGLLPEQPLTFSINTDTYAVKISADTGVYKLASENPIDFPKIPPLAAMETIELDSFSRGMLLTTIENSLYAIGTDDLRPAMCTVCLRLKPEGVLVVTTNGHHLSYTSLWSLEAMKVDTIKDLLLHASFAKALVKLHKEADPDAILTFQYNNNRISAKIGNRMASVKVVDERYPDFENAIPKNNPISLKVDRKQFLLTARRIQLLANSVTHQIRLTFNAEKSLLTVSAEDLDYSNEGSEEMLVSEYEGADIEIGFDAKFLSDCLEHMSSESVSLEMSAPNRALLGYDDDRDRMFLLMPTMLNTYA